MTVDYHPKNKAELLEVIRNEWMKLIDLLNVLTESQKTVPGVEADWSIKDILAHISAWEKLAQDRIHAAKTGEPINIPVIEGDKFVDQFNADVFDSSKDVPLETVEKEFRNSHKDFLEQIKSLDADFMQQKLPFDWSGDSTAQTLISANTHWHYRDHIDSISKWIKDQF